MQRNHEIFVTCPHCGQEFDLRRDWPIRRAKLRYHDPYPTDVKERTAAFEDGYCKGYTDAMDDVMREVAELSDEELAQLAAEQAPPVLPEAAGVAPAVAPGAELEPGAL